MKTAFVALVLLVDAGGLTGAGDQPAKFKVTTKRADDAVEVKAEKDKTVFVVKSPFGISQAIIERTDDEWPRTVMLRLHLKGLEHFRASNGKVTLEAAVSIQDGKPKVRRWKDGQEDAPLDEKNPFRVDVRILSRDDNAINALPIKDGYFEMALPKEFFEGNPKSITLNWIDFYRN